MIRVDRISGMGLGLVFLDTGFAFLFGSFESWLLFFLFGGFPRFVFFFFLWREGSVEI